MRLYPWFRVGFNPALGTVDPVMIETVVLFGATGDLAGRFVLPAVAALRAADRLPNGLQIIGAARQDLTDEAFRDLARESLDRHASAVPASVRAALAGSLRYHQVDLGDPASVSRAVGDTSGPIAAYLALPPVVYPTAVTTLGAVGLPAGSRIVVEKPFGQDLDSAVELNGLLAQAVGAAGEQAVYRVDHVLGMATVQNLLALRLYNRVFESVWNSVHIEQIELLWEEDLGLEGRAGYFDTAGTLRDVVQNHLIQVLCLIAMEPPTTLNERDIRDRKVEVLRSVRLLSEDDAASQTRRARYTAGRLADAVGGTAVSAYVDEKGVEADRGTETFAEVVLELDSPRWSGTRFVLRAGKALPRRRKQAVVRFRPTSHSLVAAGSAPPANTLRIGLDGPNDLVLQVAGGVTFPPAQLTPSALTAPPPPDDLPAYGRVLLDILGGDHLLSVRGDEAEESWRVLTPVLRAWANGRVPMLEYPAGSPGPRQG